MLAINGGHDGTAYNAGRAAAKLFKFALTLIAFRRLRWSFIYENNLAPNIKIQME